MKSRMQGQAAGARALRHTFVANPWTLGAAAALAVLALVFVFQSTFAYLYANWHRDEYSHGFLIPLISAFLLWQRRDRFAQLRFEGSWAGVALVAAGVLLYFLGSLASVTGVDAYALVIVLAGLTLATLGWPAFKVALVPLALLLLMNPIPTIFYNNISAQLQLISSQIGVAVIRLFGVTVGLEGNVIDLGTYQLQVAEACSGLRYLFPLMTLGVIFAYLFRGRTWMRWCIFLSTVPITVFMNSFRIGVIGVLVDRYGIEQAEGFLHDFEGWVIFMACFALLFIESWLLLRLTGDKRPWRDVVALDMPAAPVPGAMHGVKGLTGPALVGLAVLLLMAYPANAVAKRAEVIPGRAEFSQFPLQIAGWRGQRSRLETIYLDQLKLDDYLLANYVQTGAAGGNARGATQSLPVVNLYSAYYASQRSGAAVHSPRSCLPGGGWVIDDFGQRTIAGASIAGAPLRVNRVIIEKGDQRQLVYYWFQERGRNVTSEYLVKWYMFADSVTRQRTDGALVRLTTVLRRGETLDAGDQRLVQFASALVPALGSYLPN